MQPSDYEKYNLFKAYGICLINLPHTIASIDGMWWKCRQFHCNQMGLREVVIKK